MAKIGFSALFMAALLTACESNHSPPNQAPPEKTASLASLQRAADRFNSVISIPIFETTTNAIDLAVATVIQRANAALDRIGQLPRTGVTFQNTIQALDHVGYEAGTTGNRLSLIKEVSPDAAIRDAATEALKRFQEWSVGLDYREDVYAAVKAFAETHPKLQGEDAKLFVETLRDYRRAGLELPKDKREEVERLRKELTRLTTDFDTHINEARKAIAFTRSELEGVPDNFLSQAGIKTGEDQYTIMANVTFQFVTAMETAKKEETRRRLEVEHDNLAREKNIPLLKQILGVRHTIAARLGYASWADYQIEPKMAKNERTAVEFLERMNRGLQPKFDAELAEFQKIKARETGDATAKIYLWDWRYYSNQLKKEKYAVDEEKLRVYFPYDRVLQGMFGVYQTIFGLRIHEIDAPYRWVPDLKFYAVTDAKTGEPLGLFYLDMFPREGKYNHFAQFGIIEGKRLHDGKYQRPTVALVCNFPPPAPGKPSLLSHRDVETLFHEFGHALHSILTRATYGRFSGTSVPRDFVEAPSQMLERWVWDKKVLDSFAAHYQNPQGKIPETMISKLKEAKLATVGTFYRRQLSFGLVDLKLHSAHPPENPLSAANAIQQEVFFAPPADTAYLAYFGHLTGYDAGYYGYAWADAIAADLATVFEKSQNGFLDQEAGRRLREEIYAPGDSRDVSVSIEKFLGRPRSIDPFLKMIGVEK